MNRRLLLLGALALVLTLCACSDDDPAAPPDPGEDGVIHVPGEVATLAEAVAAAADGDTLVLAGGEFDGDVTVDKALTIRGADPLVGPGTMLDTTNGPLRLVADFRDISVSGITATGGETAIAIDVHWGDVDLGYCRVIAATHGVTVEADTGTVAMDRMRFTDCGNDVGNGSGLRIWGNGSVQLTNGVFENADGGSGVAATVSDESALRLDTVGFAGHDAGNMAVVASTGASALVVEDASFIDCAGTMVHGSGESLSLVRVEFEECAGTMVRVECGYPQSFHHTLTAHGSEGTLMSIGAGQTTQVWSSAILGHVGAAFDLADDVQLDLRHDTVVDLTGALVTAGANCNVDLTECIVVDAATPVIAADSPSIVRCDFWRVDGEPAWAGLEDDLGDDDNIEANPLFCDRAAGDYRLELGSPCALGMGDSMGAFEVGCE